jgi:hypothetical protein
MPGSFSLSVRRRRCSQVGLDVLRQDAAVLRYAPRVIRIMCAQKSAWFSGEARDVLAHLHLLSEDRNVIIDLVVGRILNS